MTIVIIGLFCWWLGRKSVSWSSPLERAQKEEDEIHDAMDSILPNSKEGDGASIVDKVPSANSPVNYWLQVYGEMQRDIGDIWEITGDLDLTKLLTKDQIRRFKNAANRTDGNMGLLSDLFYKETNKDLIKKMDF